MSQPQAPSHIPLSRFIGPRYWPVWMGLGFIRLVVQLPFPTIMACGRGLGAIAWLFSRRDKRISRTNVRLCLPELSTAEQERLVRRHFAGLGCAALESGLIWWGGDARLNPLIRIEGWEHVDRALAAGRGAILLSAHFTALEMGICALMLRAPIGYVYSPPRNALVAEIARRGRKRHAVRAIASDQPRDILRGLAENRAVWYAPDQRSTEKNSTLVPFFGHPAATHIATSKLARISGAPVLPYFPERLADGSGYVMRIGEALADFPGEDPAADALRFHRLIEAQVRRCPEQYLWSYRRFKLPGPDGDIYQ